MGTTNVKTPEDGINKIVEEFPGSPMVRTPHFHCPGHRLSSWSGS